MIKYKHVKPKQIKRLKNRILEMYGFKIPNSWSFNELGLGRYWLVDADLMLLANDLSNKKFKVERVGIYFCFMDKNRLRLSPEGAKLVGKYATKNIVFINKDQVFDIIRGFDIDINIKSDIEYPLINSDYGIIGVGKNHKTKLLCQFKKNTRIRNLKKQN